MPFPLLAHQAPVLPLKLWKPRLFSAVALCAGSLAPDLEYLRRPTRPGIGHSLLGQVVFCLPIAVGVTWVVSRFVGPAIASCLPRTARWRLEDLRCVVDPFSSAPAFARVAGSSLVGSLSHVLLDAFTHPGTWASRVFPALERVVPLFGKRFAVAMVLQLGFSLIGALAALWLLDRLLRRGAAAPGAPAPAQQAPGAGLLADATVAAMALTVLGSARVAREAVSYFQLGPVYVWGYVAFRASCAGFAGLTVGAIALRRGD